MVREERSTQLNYAPLSAPAAVCGVCGEIPCFRRRCHHGALVTGIHDDKKLQEVFLERYVMPRRQMQRRFIGEAIASGELKRGTDTELLIDAINGPLFFRWLQGHAPLNEGFAERIFEKVIPAFQTE